MYKIVSLTVLIILLSFLTLRCGGEEFQNSNEHDKNHLHRERRNTETETLCSFASEVLSCFTSDVINNRTATQLQCPTILKRLTSQACVNKTQTPEEVDSTQKWKPWIASMISIFIVSIGSLIGLVTLPFAKKKWFPYLLTFMISLGLSVLIGDGLLHLLPSALGLQGEKGEGNTLLNSDSYLWKMVLFLTGIYLFFLFEILMHAFDGDHSHSHELEEIGLKENDNQQFNINKNLITDNGNEEEEVIVYRKAGIPVKQFKTIVWMILIGDAIHNFMDGVAIGAAYSEEWPSGLHGGISTSIAMVLHELPHELGDFAILLGSGLSVKQALVMNFISSLTAFGGGILGAAISQNWHAQPWIFAITAGLFVYIALADMLPQILHKKSTKTQPWTSIFLQASGMLLGFVIMFLIAAWEKDLNSIVS